MPSTLETLQHWSVALSWLLRGAYAGPDSRPHDVGSMALPGRRSLHVGSRRDLGRDLCMVWIDTYPWTKCEGFAKQYGITLEDFIDMNPSVASDCYGWVGGSKYCVLMRKKTWSRHL